MKRKQSLVEDIQDDFLEYDLFFSSSDSDSASNLFIETNQISDNEEELPSDIEWEEVPLETNKNTQARVINLQATIDN